MRSPQKKWLIRGVATLVIGVVAATAWNHFNPRREESLASGNGRIEATEIDVAARIAGRIKEILVREGEFVKAGQVRVLTLVDLSDVYMTFFLPTAAVGRVALGTEVRLVLDAAPGYVIPARVSFIADVAQFTPKTVETASEREKLMFRVRAQIPVELL